MGEGEALGEGVAPPTPGDLEGELEGVVLREPEREGVPLREPERDGDCDAVADGVLLGVEPKELVAVPLRDGVGERVPVLEVLGELPEDEVGVLDGVPDGVRDLEGVPDLVADLVGD